MDAIDFLRKKYSVPSDKQLVDVVGKSLPLDIVMRLLEEYRQEQAKGAKSICTCRGELGGGYVEVCSICHGYKGC